MMQMNPPNPWHPMTNSVDLKHLGKLAEASAAVARCVIQGIDESEPVTGKPNKEWLEDELSDVMTNISLCLERFALDQNRMMERGVMKAAHLKQWHYLA